MPWRRLVKIYLGEHSKEKLGIFYQKLNASYKVRKTWAQCPDLRISVAYRMALALGVDPGTFLHRMAKMTRPPTYNADGSVSCSVKRHYPNQYIPPPPPTLKQRARIEAIKAAKRPLMAERKSDPYRVPIGPMPRETATDGPTQESPPDTP